MKKLQPYITYALLIVAGILIGTFFFGGSESSSENLDTHIEETHTDEEGDIIYTCSMHPSVRQNEPGDCPICGMDLIPAEQSSSDELDPDALTMTETAVKLAGISTSEVVAQKPVKTITLPGKVTFNQTNTRNVTAHFPGRITQLVTDFDGAFVEKGQVVAKVYSPELVSAQQELLEAVKIKEAQPGLYESARKKLLRWEISPSIIDQFEASGEIQTSIPITSPATGYVTKLKVQEQDYVNRGSVLFSVSDLSSVWVEFDAYESVMNEISVNDSISYKLTSIPGEMFSGKVTYIQPVLDQKKQTLSIRAESQNPDLRLKPGMLAEGQISAQTSQHPQLLVPSSAVLWTGKRSLVFEQLSDRNEPTFIAREIVLGQRVGDFFVVHEGISQGAQVVTNGTFKVDAAAQLADKRSMMNTEPGTGSNVTGHDHGDMNMGENVEMESMDQSQHEQMKNGRSTEVSKQLVQNSERIMNNYFKLKEALVMSDISAALKTVRSLNVIADEFNGTMSESEKEFRFQVGEFMNTKTIEQVREVFADFSPLILNLAESAPLNDPVYKLYCPMADDNNGAIWLSKNDEVRNPYYGDMMLTCGEVQRKISK